MIVLLLRVTGRVIRTDYRDGAKLDQNTGTYNPWARHEIKVLVADSDVTTIGIFVRYKDGEAQPTSVTIPLKDDWIDWVVEVSTRQGRLEVGAQGPWDRDAALDRLTDRSLSAV